MLTIYIERNKKPEDFATLTEPAGKKYSFEQVKKLYRKWADQKFIEFKKQNLTSEWILKTYKENVKCCKTVEDKEDWDRRWADPSFIEDCFIEEYPDYEGTNEDKAKAFIELLKSQGWTDTENAISMCIGHNIGDVC